MALTITNEATALSTTSGATLALTVTAAVGTMLVMGIAADNAGASGVSSFTNVTDSAGNAWVTQAVTNYTVGGVAGDGTTNIIATCTVATALVAGTVTVNFSPNTTAKAAVIKKVTAAAGEMILVIAVGPGATGSGLSWAAPTVSVTSGDTIVGVLALESQTVASDSDTTNGSWSAANTALANTGVVATSQAVNVQTKTVNATGNQTYDPTGGGSRDFAANYIILRPLTASGSAAGIGAAAATLSAIGTAIGSAAGGASVSGAGSAPLTTVGRARGYSHAYAVFEGTQPAPGDALSLRILVQIDWVTDPPTTTRLWDGGGPWVDAALNIWIGAGALGSPDAIDQAINAEAAEIDLTLSGVGAAESGIAWLDYTNDEIIGSAVQILIQPCDTADQPIGLPEVRFTGAIDDISFLDTVVDGRRQSTISVPVVNKFTVRRLKSGAVLSDADQQARSAVLNPGAAPDRFCERVPALADRTVTWPRWN